MRDLRPPDEDVEVRGHPQHVIAIECVRQGHPFERDHRNMCRHEMPEHFTKFPGQGQIVPTVQECQSPERSRDCWRDLARAEPLEMMRDEGHDPMETGLVEEGGPIRGRTQ